jgi:hypothetical protein
MCYSNFIHTHTQQHWTYNLNFGVRTLSSGTSVKKVHETSAIIIIIKYFFMETKTFHCGAQLYVLFSFLHICLPETGASWRRNTAKSAEKCVFAMQREQDCTLTALPHTTGVTSSKTTDI